MRKLSETLSFILVYVTVFDLVQKKKLSAAFLLYAYSSFFFIISYALSTLPDFKQEVQTYNLFVAPFTLHLTDLMFGLNILLDLLCEWLTLLPKRTPFPQTEHLAILTPPCTIKCFKSLNLTWFQTYNTIYFIRRDSQMQGQNPENFIFLR